MFDKFFSLFAFDVGIDLGTPHVLTSSLFSTIRTRLEERTGGAGCWKGGWRVR